MSRVRGIYPDSQQIVGRLAAEASQKSPVWQGEVRLRAMATMMCLDVFNM